MNIPYRLIAAAPVHDTDEAVASWIINNKELIDFIVNARRKTPDPLLMGNEGRPMLNDNMFIDFLHKQIGCMENAMNQSKLAKKMAAFGRVSVGGAIRVLNRLVARGIVKTEKDDGYMAHRMYWMEALPSSVHNTPDSGPSADDSGPVEVD